MEKNKQHIKNKQCIKNKQSIKNLKRIENQNCPRYYNLVYIKNLENEEFYI